jgi:hypothetical protein
MRMKRRRESVSSSAMALLPRHEADVQKATIRTITVK